MSVLGVRVWCLCLSWLAAGVVVLPAGAAEHRVSSPDGTITVTVSDEGGLRYRVDVDGLPLLKPSRLGLEFAGGVRLGPSAAVERASERFLDETWRNPFGKRAGVRSVCQQLALKLYQAGVPERRFGLVVRAYDDGVALRYELPESSGLGVFNLVHEQTEFAFAEDSRCWVGEPSSCAECLYRERRLSGIPRAGGNGAYLSTLPLVLQTRQVCAAVAESDLRDWAGMFLTGTGTPTVRVALAPRGDGRGCVVSQAPRQSPWRVVMIAREPAGLVGSDLIASLAAPSRIDDTSWIRPGACAWDPWWTGVNTNLPAFTGVWSRGDTQAHKSYIDFAAEMGWPYQLVDWFWYENMTSYDIALNLGGKNPERPPVDFEKCVPHVDMPALLEHARKRGVRLLVWLHSYDLERYGVERACELFAKWGVAGLKIDFLNSDSQETVAWCERVLDAAAKRRLLVDFHGVYKATGLARTWPNCITQEGVLGNEYNKLEGSLCTPLHTVTLPFTRGLLGPMDFTPGGFINVAPARFAITQPAQVMGTRARQLAMPVVYESPLTVFCDSPANYRGAAGLAFYRGLPTVWDETVVPAAEIARHVVVARRSGGAWWVAALNGDEALELRVPLNFLEAGAWTLRRFEDAPDAAAEPAPLVERSQTVTRGDVLEIKLAPAGGFAATLRRP